MRVLGSYLTTHPGVWGRWFTGFRQHQYNRRCSDNTTSTHKGQISKMRCSRPCSANILVSEWVDLVTCMQQQVFPINIDRSNASAPEYNSEGYLNTTGKSHPATVRGL